MVDLEQTVRDREHLKILTLAFYIIGGIEAAFGLIPLIHIFIGGAMLTGSVLGAGNDGQELGLIGLLFTTLGIFVLLFLQAFAWTKILAGYWISRRRNRLLCMIAAIITCLSIPYGTVLGVFTLIVLARESVVKLFEGNPVEVN